MLSFYVGSSFHSGSPLSSFHRRPGKSSIISANSPVGFFSLQLGNLQAMAPLHQPPPWGLASSSLAVSTEAGMPCFTGLKQSSCLQSARSFWKSLVSVFTMIYINLSLNTHIKSALNPVSSLPKSSHWERHCFISGLLPSPWLYPLICITNCSTQAKQCHTVDTHFTRDRSFYLFTKKQMFKHLLKYCDLPPADWIFPSSNITRKTNIYQSRSKLYSEKGVL